MIASRHIQNLCCCIFSDALHHNHYSSILVCHFNQYFYATFVQPADSNRTAVLYSSLVFQDIKFALRTSTKYRDTTEVWLA